MGAREAAESAFFQMKDRFGGLVIVALESIQRNLSLTLLNVSSRTPEGLPSKCSLCGASTNIVFSDQVGDAVCPNCGCLIWESAQLLDLLQGRFADGLGVSLDIVNANLRFDELGADSLETVELIMELEEEFDVVIPDDVAGNMKTVGDVIRYIERFRRKRRGD